MGDRSGDPLIRELATGAFVVSGLAAGALLLWAGTPLPLLAFGGACTTVLLAVRPAWGAVLVLALWGTVLDPAWGSVGVGPLDLSAAELALAAGLGGLTLRHLTGHARAGPSFLGAPVLAFTGAAVFGAAVGVVAGVAAGQVLGALLALLALTTFFLLREGFADDPRGLVRALVGVALAGTLLALLDAAVGLGLTAQTRDYVITAGEYQEVTRLDPAVLRLLSLVVLVVVARGVLPDRRLPRLALLGAFVVLEVLSFTRSTWTPLLLAALVLPALLADHARWRVLVGRVTVLAVASAAALAVMGAGLLGPTGLSAYDRLASTVRPETLQESSLSDRQREVVAAAGSIRQHPVTGIGLTAPYGIMNEDYDELRDLVVSTPATYIHNTFVGVWLWTGLPGVLATAWLSVRLVRAGRRVHALRHLPDGRAVAATTVGLGVLAVQSTFQTNLFYPPALVALAAGLALVDVWLGAHAPPRGRRPSGGPRDRHTPEAPGPPALAPVPAPDPAPARATRAETDR